MAAGRPTYLASDTWTQSRFQLAGNANARLKDMLFGSIFWQPSTAEYLFLTHIAMSYQKTRKKTHLASIKDIMQKKRAFIEANVFRHTAQD